MVMEDGKVLWQFLDGWSAKAFEKVQLWIQNRRQLFGYTHADRLADS